MEYYRGLNIITCLESIRLIIAWKELKIYGMQGGHIEVKKNQVKFSFILVHLRVTRVFEI